MIYGILYYVDIRIELIRYRFYPLDMDLNLTVAYICLLLYMDLNESRGYFMSNDLDDLDALYRYYEELMSWNNESSCEGYDVDIALTKDKLEKIFVSVKCYGCIGSEYESFIQDLREEFIESGDTDLLESLNYLSRLIIYSYNYTNYV